MLLYIHSHLNVLLPVSYTKAQHSSVKFSGTSVDNV